ncbi:MAG TPA: AAA family ATPase [Patescibacteria group bacterium]|nr:AAA family ATPase [Patescibacteria group bacterium]
MSAEPVRVERHDATQVALRAAIEQVNQVVFGKRAQIDLSFACLLAGGHLLIEDVPGVGKTTLAHAMATSLGLSYQRIQFTSDLLPSDILGVSIFDRDTGQFRFHPGPIFAQLVLADEINRATPKTQSALLEAMAEQQVTADGESRPLPQPFLVIATQNPVDLAGTFPLPDSQLDRFLMRISLGYPDAEGERQMLAASDRRELLTQLGARLDSAQLLEIRHRVAHVTTSAALIDYVQRLLAATRGHAQMRIGLSPRAGLALLAAARAVAYLANRAFVLPEDVQAVFGPVAAHRLVPAAEANLTRDALAADVLKSVRVD